MDSRRVPIRKSESPFEGRAAVTRSPRAATRATTAGLSAVCIGLVATSEGLPVACEIFAGNRTDGTMVEEMVATMEKKYGQAERLGCSIAGWVSEDNPAFLRARKAYYIVGTPKAQLRPFEAQLLEKKGWQPVRADVEVKLVPHPDGAGRAQFALGRGEARREAAKNGFALFPIVRIAARGKESLRKRQCSRVLAHEEDGGMGDATFARDQEKRVAASVERSHLRQPKTGDAFADDHGWHADEPLAVGSRDFHQGPVFKFCDHARLNAGGVEPLVHRATKRRVGRRQKSWRFMQRARKSFPQSAREFWRSTNCHR